jgi:hypothetical protein
LPGNRNYGIVICNRYEDIIQPLLKSLAIAQPKPRVVIVANGHTRSYGYEMVRYDGPGFVFAKAANLGIRHLGEDDVFLINDDTWFEHPCTFGRIRQAAYSEPNIGIVSPLIKGCVGNRFQRWHEVEYVWPKDIALFHVTDDSPVCFPFIFLQRDMLNAIGLMTEVYDGYGADDWDLCRRARAAGWRTSVTRRVMVTHGDGSNRLAEGYGASWSMSYARRYKGRIVASHLTGLEEIADECKVPGPVKS